MAGIYLGLSSCCTKMYWLGFDDLNEIQLINFNAADADSIAFEIFERNSNFANRIDSSFTSAHVRDAGNTELIIFMPEHINLDHDYKITLNSTGQVYKLTEIANKKEECNCPSDKYNVLDSYYVNGERHNSTSLTITK